MLHTGLLSGSEFWMLGENPHWYQSGRVVVPEIPHHVARTVRLSFEGRHAVEAYLVLMKNGNGTRSRNTIRDAMRRAAAKEKVRVGDKWVPKVPNGINPEMLRRSLCAWLMAAYPERWDEILASMGMLTEDVAHTEPKFERQELEKIRQHLKGW